MRVYSCPSVKNLTMRLKNLCCSVADMHVFMLHFILNVSESIHLTVIPLTCILFYFIQKFIHPGGNFHINCVWKIGCSSCAMPSCSLFFCSNSAGIFPRLPQTHHQNYTFLNGVIKLRLSFQFAIFSP